MHLSPESATSVTLSPLILHNYLLKSSSKSTYCTPGLIDQKDEQGNVIAGSWCSEHMAKEFRSIVPQCHRNNPSKYIREVFMDYFMNEGAVTWQWDKY